MYTINFNGKIDKRLEVRSKSLSRSMLANCSTSIQSISSSRAEQIEQIGNYRLLHNASVTEAVLIGEQQARCGIQVSGKTVLCIHDSSESNFNRHINRLKLGWMVPALASKYTFPSPWMPKAIIPMV